MRLERKHAVVLLLIAVWNVLTYARFTKALVQTQEDRPTGYYVAHTVLIVVNMLIAGVLGRWGWQALRPELRARSPDVDLSHEEAHRLARTKGSNPVLYFLVRLVLVPLMRSSSG